MSSGPMYIGEFFRRCNMYGSSMRTRRLLQLIYIIFRLWISELATSPCRGFLSDPKGYMQRYIYFGGSGYRRYNNILPSFLPIRQTRWPFPNPSIMISGPSLFGDYAIRCSEGYKASADPIWSYIQLYKISAPIYVGAFHCWRPFRTQSSYILAL